MGLLLTNARIFLAESDATCQSLRINDGKIEAIGAPSEVARAGDVVCDLAGRFVAAGLIDIQVNGGGGRLLCDRPSLDTIARMVVAHRPYGTTAMLPTLITSDLDTMRRAAEAVNEALAQRMEGVLGLHFEGPLLSGKRKGVHDEGLFRRVEADLVEILTSLEGGNTLVTLAPEQVSTDFIAELISRGIVVSLGHTDCDFGQARAAFAAGATCVTHLFNAMRPMLNRAPGLVGAALLDEDVYCGLIVDGHHVDPATLRIALAANGLTRTILVTDAMADVGKDLRDFNFGGEVIQYANGRMTTANGTLAGSALSMIEAVRNACAMLGVKRHEALQMASANPARLLGIIGGFGEIRVGGRADLIVLDDQFKVTDTMVSGRFLFQTASHGGTAE